MLLKKWKEQLNIPRKRPLVDKLYEEEYLHISIKKKKSKFKIIQISLDTGEIITEF